MTSVDRDFELALVERLRAGDTAAFEEVHAAFNTRLFTFLLRLSRRRDVAEDLLEETWLRFVAKAGSLRPDTLLGPWLFTVARNRFLSHCRSRMVEISHAADLMGLWPAPSRAASPFEDTAATELERRLEAALASLPVSYREVLLLVSVEGLRPSDAAAVCGITPATLRQRLHRARELLARRLDEPRSLGAVPIGEVIT